MKIRFPFPTSRNDQLRGGSGWNRIEDSLQQIAGYINDGTNELIQAVNAATAAAEQAGEYADEAFSGTPEGYDTLVSDVSDIKSALDITTITSTNLLDLESLTMGKYMWNNTESSSASYCYADYIPVTPGKTYSFQTQTTSAIGSRANRGIRFLCEYGEDKTYIRSKENTSSSNGYTAPEDVYYIIPSFEAAYFSNTSTTKPAIVEGTDIVPYTEYFDPYKKVTIKDTAYNKPDVLNIVKEYIPNGARYSFDLSNSTYTTDEQFEDIQNYTITFKGSFSDFDDLTIYKNVTQNNRVIIDGTSVKVYMGTTAVLSADHDLTLADYISVSLIANKNNTAKVKIYTNGGSYTSTAFTWDVRNGYLAAKTTGIISDCILSYYCSDYTADIQLYGDSYFSAAHTDRWTSYLNASGYNNFLLNAFSGRNSAQGLTTLKKVLERSNPLKIIWCEGMNDADTDSAVNASWKSCVDELMQICADRGIELILATIPNVPSVNNAYKNAYVISSNYRYIDFAAAVGASSGTTWYDDMLSNDNVHPSIQGAIALFTQAIADVPELMD